MAVSKLIVILLLVAYVEADINSLIAEFNSTIQGKCKLGTTTISSTSTSTTPTSTGSTATVTSASSATATSASTATSTAASTAAQSTTASVSDRCKSEEISVWGANNVAVFHTNLKAYSECQKNNCTSLTTAVENLLAKSVSGSTSLKICGIFLGLMFVISYFG